MCNAGSYSTDAVAQHTFALILNYFNKVSLYDSYIKEGGYAESETFSTFKYGIEELTGKTIGIVGFGSIGRAVAKIAEAFSMKVMVYSRTARQDNYNYVSFEELLDNSDIITVHCPLNDASCKLFNKETLSKCRKSALLVNTARGAIVDEQALCDALNEGLISGAALDVFETEPLPADSPLIKAKNIILTPHVAWAPTQTRLRLLNIVVECFEAYLRGEERNVIV